MQIALSGLKKMQVLHKNINENVKQTGKKKDQQKKVDREHF